MGEGTKQTSYGHATLPLARIGSTCTSSDTNIGKLEYVGHHGESGSKRSGKDKR